VGQLYFTCAKVCRKDVILHVCNNDEYTNAHHCNHFGSIYARVSKNHCLSTLHVFSPVDVDGYPHLSASSTFQTTRTHFTVAQSSVHNWQQIVDGSLQLSFLQTPKHALSHVGCWDKPLVERVCVSACSHVWMYDCIYIYIYIYIYTRMCVYK
jgi:hypothetical protein